MRFMQARFATAFAKQKEQGFNRPSLSRVQVPPQGCLPSDFRHHHQRCTSPTNDLHTSVCSCCPVLLTNCWTQTDQVDSDSDCAAGSPSAINSVFSCLVNSKLKRAFGSAEHPFGSAAAALLILPHVHCYACLPSCRNPRKKRKNNCHPQTRNLTGESWKTIIL